MKTDDIIQRTANTGLAKVAVQCTADTFVVNQSIVLRINICSDNRHFRQARNFEKFSRQFPDFQVTSYEAGFRAMAESFQARQGA